MLEPAHISRMISPHRLVGVLVLCLLQACVSTPPTPVPMVDWPATLPDRQVFVQAWRDDRANQALQAREDYLTWVKTFFEGSSTASGWLEMSAEVRERVDPEVLALAEPKLANLGVRIAREWAKDNAVRRIDTRAVAAWRTALQEALWRNDILGFLGLLDADVSALLAGTLEGELISLERYYLVEEVEFE